MSETTIRGLVADIQRELLTREVVPSRARELLIEATALFGNCGTEVREAEADYNRVLVEFLDGRGEEPANRATIRAKSSPSYQRLREATDTLKLVVEMIRSLKVVLKSVEEEMRLAR